MTCESCGKYIKTEDVEGHQLCEECKDFVIRCRKCTKFLGINYESIIDSSGRCQFIELIIPGEQTNFVFCDSMCLHDFVTGYVHV